MSGKVRNIQIKNASFEERIPGESPVPEAENFDFLIPPRWNDYDPNNLVPREGEGTLGSAFYSTWRAPKLFFDEIPDGKQITSIFLNQDANGKSLEGRGEVGIAQTTAEKVQSNTTYTLSASILDTKDPTGQFPFFNGITGARLDILAGNKVVASKEFLDYGEGEVFQGEVSFNSRYYTDIEGEKITVRLVNLNLDNGVDGGNGFEINFDDVELTAKSGSGGRSTNGNDLLIGDNISENTLIGGMGDDTLFGGGVNDVLIGGKGDDFIVGGLGDNQATGGEGADSYGFIADAFSVLEPGKTIISDFDVNQDQIFSQTGDDQFSDLRFQGSSILSANTGKELFILSGVNTSELTENNFGNFSGSFDDIVG